MAKKSIKPKLIQGRWKVSNIMCSDGQPKLFKRFGNELRNYEETFLRVIIKDNDFTIQGHARAQYLGSCVQSLMGKITDHGSSFISIRLKNFHCSDGCRDFCEEETPARQLLGTERVYYFRKVGKMLKMQRKVKGMSKDNKKTHQCGPGSYEIMLLTKEKAKKALRVIR